MNSKSMNMVAGLMVLVGTAVEAPAGMVRESAGSGATPKQIIVESGSATPAPSSALSVQLIPRKTSYEVGEAITFRIIPNRKAYVYLFNMPKEGEAVLLYPNDLEGANQVSAGKEITVPGKGRFAADRSGTERVVLIGSEQKLDVSRLTAGAAGFEQVSKATVEKAAKNIIVERPNSFVKTLDIEIKGKPGQAEDADAGETGSDEEASATVFLQTDQLRYRLEQAMTVRARTDRAGYLSLYERDPSGKLSLVRQEKVAEDSVQAIKGKAGSPKGEYHMIAVLTEKEGEAEAAAEQALAEAGLGKKKSSTAKGFVVVEPLGAAVYRYTIE